MRTAIFLLLLVIFAPVSSVHAYTTIHTEGGLQLFWDTDALPIRWYLHQDGLPGKPFENVQSTLQSAFDTWQNAPCSKLSFLYGGKADVTPDRIGTLDYDSRNVLAWVRESEWSGEWTDAFAVTVPLFETDTGRVLDADILFKENFGWSLQAEGDREQVDLLAIAVHEIGHLAGLDHSENRDATMFFSAVVGETYKRTLAADDIQGICHLYPKSQAEGSPCDSSLDCEAGVECVEHEDSGGSICSPSCECPVDCSPAFTCLEGRCLPPEPELGGMGATCNEWLPCMDTEMICVSGICSTYCQDADDCPESWRCARIIGGGNACYRWTGGDGPALIQTIQTGEESPAEEKTEIIVTVDTGDVEGLFTRFFVRSMGGRWEKLKDYSIINLVRWTPERAGMYEILAEVREEESDTCRDDYRILPFTILSDGVEDPDGDGSDGADGDGSGSGGGGCRTNGPFSFLLFLLSIPLISLYRYRFSTKESK